VITPESDGQENTEKEYKLTITRTYIMCW